MRILRPTQGGFHHSERKTEDTRKESAMGDQLIRVDMTTQTATVEEFPEKWKYLGGRSLSARILVEECNATCDPLGPDNVLVLAPGPVDGPDVV